MDLFIAFELVNVFIMFIKVKQLKLIYQNYKTTKK